MLERPDDDEDDEEEKRRKKNQSPGGGGSGPKGKAGWSASNYLESISDDEEEVESPTLLSCQAEDAMTKEKFQATLPIAWMGNIDRNNLVRVKAGWEWSVYHAVVQDAKDFKLTIEVTDANAIPTVRELEVIERLTASRRDGDIKGDNLVAVLDTHVVADQAYFLYEGEDLTLDQALAGKKLKLLRRKKNKAWKPAMGFKTSIPVTIDLLRGAADLEEARIIHKHISPEHVVIVDKRRAVIGGLSDACIVSESKKVGKPSLKDTIDDAFIAAPFWQPPEVDDGIPQGAGNHVWGIGMILATMCFGTNPAETLISQVKPTAWPDLYFPSGRRDVREILKAQLDIEQVPDFENLDDDMKEVLRGMLNKDPEERWTTKLALEKMEKLALKKEAAGVEVPMPRQRPSLPACWKDDGEQEEEPAPSEQERRLQRSDWLGASGSQSAAAQRDVSNVIFEDDADGINGDAWQ